MDSKQYKQYEKPYKFKGNRNLKASQGCRVCMEQYMHNNEQYNITSVITASHLNAEISVNTEPHCDGPWFQPTYKVLHYGNLLC